MLQSTNDLILSVRKLRDFALRKARTVKIIRTDNQFLTAAIKAFCEQPLINIELTGCAPYEHGEIGLIERRNGIIKERKSKMMGRSISPKFFGYAHIHAVFLGNCMPDHEHPQRLSPYEQWHNGMKVDLDKTPLLVGGTR